MPEYAPVLPSRYELSRRIGEGAASTIWSARDLTRGTDVALKMPIRAEYLPYILKRFAGEFETASRFEHQNLLRAFDVDASGTEFTPYLATELVPGRTMDDRMHADGAMDARRVAEVGIQLTDALRTIHAADLVHRDVKPENVMIADDGQIRLIDFGSTARRGDPEVEHTVGTWGYAAPESADAHGALLNRRPNFVRPVPDPAVDVYAAGLILHEAATGRLVFENANDRWAQIDARVPRLAEVLDTVPPKLDQLVADMTAKDPGDRPTAAEALTTLREIAAESAVPPEVAHLHSMMAGQAPPGRPLDSSTNSPTAASSQLSLNRQRAGQPPQIG
ncbi:serine/threonine-protein kinase [Kribbella sp. NPDC054772]